MRAHCYAVRRLNPFAGVAQVISIEGARAISLDGLRWEIQVLAEAPTDFWGSLNSHAAAIRFFRFGLWSPDKGLSRVPINPIMDVGAMLRASDALLAQLAPAVASLPFALEDPLELWQFGRDGSPLALMMSAMDDENLETLRPRHWVAAPLHDRNLGRERLDGQLPVADDLERLVHSNAGDTRAGWLRRTAPGSGEGHPLGEDSASGQRLPADAFPDLPLSARWPSPADRALVERWIAWAAPRLLCLPYLDAHTRAGLERLAGRAALDVNALWRLYPTSVDPEFVTAARVEAALRQAGHGV